ncbi:MAG: hypothetical protein IKV38_03905, partial [Clostridia bacterium]|nr:hypothetical protein [Clostridia bacterium]
MNNKKVVSNGANKKFSPKKIFKLNRKVFSYPYVLFMLLFVVLPLVMILINAFLVDGKFSFENFKIFFTESASMTILGNSLLV